MYIKSSYGSPLFSDESILSLNHVEINNITTDYKNLFESSSIKFNNIVISNITLYSENEESSLISSTNDNKEIILNNVTMNNINSAGNIIFLKGKNANIQLFHVTIKNIQSYGPIIKSKIDDNVSIIIELIY